MPIARLKGSISRYLIPNTRNTSVESHSKVRGEESATMNARVSQRGKSSVTTSITWTYTWWNDGAGGGLTSMIRLVFFKHGRKPATCRHCPPLSREMLLQKMTLSHREGTCAVIPPDGSALATGDSIAAKNITTSNRILPRIRNPCYFFLYIFTSHQNLVKSPPQGKQGGWS